MITIRRNDGAPWWYTWLVIGPDGNALREKGFPSVSSAVDWLWAKYPYEDYEVVTETNSRLAGLAGLEVSQ